MADDETTHADAPTPAIACTDLAVRRGGEVVWSSGTFTIQRGSIAAVIGPNGSGKTTLLETALGLLEPAEGTLEVLGAPPRRGDPRIGYVPQNYTAAIGDAVRCRDLVSLGLSGTRWGFGRLDAADRARVDEALERVGAAPYADRRVSELSGGQQQRVAVAQALVHEPELLLLDEPLANLDIRNQNEIVELLRELHGRMPVTILIVVHDLNPLLSLLDAAVYLLDGHPHYGAIGDVVDGTLLSHLYGTAIRVVKTPQGDLFTRSA